MQETPEEATYSKARQDWLNATAWRPATTKSGKAVFVNVDSAKVVWTPPSPDERKAQKAKADAVARAAKVAMAGKTSVAEALAGKLGKTLQEVLAEYEENQKAARNRLQRANKRRQTEMGLAQ